MLVAALDLALVHAAPANSALFLPEVSLFASDYLGGGGRSAAAVPAAFFAVGTWLMAMGRDMSIKEPAMLRRLCAPSAL